MTTTRTSVREARRTLSQILNSGKTATIGPTYGSARGFIVSIPQHADYNHAEKKKALSEAKRQFTAAWIAEAQQ